MKMAVDIAETCRGELVHIVGDEIFTYQLLVDLMLYAPCIILQYVYKPTRCTKFL